MKPIDSKTNKELECPWEVVGENTGGFVFWCPTCGAIIDEDGMNFGLPTKVVGNIIDCQDLTKLK
jgi:hypothetical protein